MRGAAEVMDGPEVTFVHGDLYETQVVMDPAGGVATFLDFDECAYADPAMDVGSILAHILLVNPVTREAVMGIRNPMPKEFVAPAERLLQAYRTAAGLSDAAQWQGFVARAKGWMWVRIGALAAKLAHNVHGEKLVDLLRRSKVEPFGTDPFRLHAISSGG